MVSVASASAPRASLTPTRISALLQSSSAPGGSADGTPVRSKVASNFESERKTGTLKSERWRSSVVILKLAVASEGNTRYMPRFGDAFGYSGCEYGIARVGPRKVC